MALKGSLSSGSREQWHFLVLETGVEEVGQSGNPTVVWIRVSLWWQSELVVTSSLQEENIRDSEWTEPKFKPTVQ